MNVEISHKRGQTTKGRWAETHLQAQGEATPHFMVARGEQVQAAEWCWWKDRRLYNRLFTSGEAAPA